MTAAFLETATYIRLVAPTGEEPCVVKGEYDGGILRNGGKDGGPIQPFCNPVKVNEISPLKCFGDSTMDEPSRPRE